MTLHATAQRWVAGGTMLAAVCGPTAAFADTLEMGGGVLSALRTGTPNLFSVSFNTPTPQTVRLIADGKQAGEFLSSNGSFALPTANWVSYGVITYDGNGAVTGAAKLTNKNGVPDLEEAKTTITHSSTGVGPNQKSIVTINIDGLQLPQGTVQVRFAPNLHGNWTTKATLDPTQGYQQEATGQQGYFQLRVVR